MATRLSVPRPPASGSFLPRISRQPESAIFKTRDRSGGFHSSGARHRASTSPGNLGGATASAAGRRPNAAGTSEFTENTAAFQREAGWLRAKIRILRRTSSPDKSSRGSRLRVAHRMRFLQQDRETGGCRRSGRTVTCGVESDILVLADRGASPSTLCCGSRRRFQKRQSGADGCPVAAVLYRPAHKLP